MTATLLTIGDEILIGQIVNTNAAWMGERLNLAGVEVRRSVAVGDDEDVIRAALEEALAESEVVLVTGGLGPTHDDLTREALAAHFGRRLREDAATMARIEERFRMRGRPMPERNRVQALVPDGFEVLANDRGTAPGLWFEAPAGRRLAVLPGVPGEMKHLMETHVLPRLAALEGARPIRHRTLHTAGVGESHLAEALGDYAAFLDARTHLAFLPSGGAVRLRITATGEDAPEVDARVERFAAYLRERAGDHLFGEGDTTLEAAVGALLVVRGQTIAVAESCTGGLVLDRLTNTPGSSDYLAGGVVPYSYEAKKALAGVTQALLDEHGAVSEAVARALARGVRERLGSDVAVSTTGVAGPGGGTPEKPVGTVWIGYADADGDFATRHRFTDDRLFNKQLAATTALDLVRRRLTRTASPGA